MTAPLVALVALIGSVVVAGSASAETKGVVQVVTADGRIEVIGSGRADSLTLSQAAGQLTVAGTSGSATTVSVNGAEPQQSVSVPVASTLIIRTRSGADFVGLNRVSLDRLVIRTGSNNDRIVLRDVGANSARFDGGAGIDSLNKGLSRIGRVISRNFEGAPPAPPEPPQPTPPAVLGRPPVLAMIPEADPAPAPPVLGRPPVLAMIPEAG